MISSGCLNSCVSGNGDAGPESVTSSLSIFECDSCVDWIYGRSGLTIIC